MTKMILIICVIMIGSILLLTSNSFAAREKRGHHHDRAGHYQKWNKPVHYKHGWAWGHHPKLHHYSPVNSFRYKHHRWYRRPVYRHGHPRSHYRRPSHTVVQEVNNYYGSSESYAEPEDEFNASASISDTGFSFSVGVSRTDWSHNLKNRINYLICNEVFEVRGLHKFERSALFPTDRLNRPIGRICRFEPSVAWSHENHRYWGDEGGQIIVNHFWARIV